MSHSPAETLTSKLRIIQTMRAIMALPPTENLLAKVEEARLAGNNSPTLTAFLSLLATGSQRNRDIAYTMLTDMQESLALEDPIAVPAETPVGPLDRTRTMIAEPVAEESAAMSSADPVEAQLVVIETPKPFYREGLFESITLRYGADGEEGEDEKYSIIPFDATAELFDGHRIATVAGVIVGVQGQGKVEHGFGFTLPFPPEGQPFDADGRSPWQVKMRMSYPRSMPTVDKQALGTLPGSAQFLAMHQCLQWGYQFLLEMQIVPVNGRFSLSMSPTVLLERRSAEGQVIAFDAAHLDELNFATSQLGFVGFLAKEETNRG